MSIQNKLNRLIVKLEKVSILWMVLKIDHMNLHKYRINQSPQTFLRKQCQNHLISHRFNNMNNIRIHQSHPIFHRFIKRPQRAQTSLKYIKNRCHQNHRIFRRLIWLNRSVQTPINLLKSYPKLMNLKMGQMIQLLYKNRDKRSTKVYHHKEPHNSKNKIISPKER